jgi:DNA-binding GntR family transcriptional regulator
MKRATREDHFLRRRPQLFLPPIALDKECPLSMQRQIHLQIRRAIRSGSIGYEARLPSSRTMARLLGVSRNTVLAAYDELAAEDLIRGERGAGMRVNRSAAVPDVTLFGLRQVVEEANYPARVLALEDPDENSLYIRF